MRNLFRAMACCFVALLPAAAHAGPRVVADIAPVHSLVAQVMQGVGSPVLLLPPGASPHHYALKPSQAAALARAEVVFWIGEELTPWLADPLSTLAPDAERVALIRLPATKVLPVRELDRRGARTAGSGRAAGADGHDEHGHQHDGTDPHVWLDPPNAWIWLEAIADRLAAHDPVHAALYRRNARTGQAAIDRLFADLAKAFAPVRPMPFIAAHDSLQYVERRFGLQAVASIAAGDDTPPGPRRVAALARLMETRQIQCVLTEPGADTSLAERLAERTGARIGVADIMGAAEEPGPALYGRMMLRLAEELAECLRVRD